MDISVVLAEDNYLIRAGTAALLAAVPGVSLAATACDADELLATVEERQPDVVITDVRMPPTHTTEGLVAAIAIRERYPEVGVILLTQFTDPDYAHQLLRHGAAGVGYLLKERIADIDELARSLRQVAAGGSALDPELVEALLDRRAKERDSPVATLSPREREVLEQMAQGKNNAAIGRSLFLSERAVQKHINSLFAKLDLNHHDDAHRRVLAVLTYLDSGVRRTRSVSPTSEMS
jgi:DNA-binding NarL/FixJ family response regulator